MEMLKLYQYKSCPFCIRVRNFLDENRLEYETVEVGRDPRRKQEILALTGDTQVPVIKDGALAMNESLNIINYIREKYLK